MSNKTKSKIKIASKQIKGATFPGSHDPRFCKLVIDLSKHLLKPVYKIIDLKTK